jgi:hypothetical protein
MKGKHIKMVLKSIKMDQLKRSDNKLEYIKIGDKIIYIKDLYSGQEIYDDEYFDHVRRIMGNYEYKDKLSTVIMCYNQDKEFQYFSMKVLDLDKKGQTIEFVSNKGQVVNVTELGSLAAMLYSDDNQFSGYHFFEQLVYNNVIVAFAFNENKWELVMNPIERYKEI